MMCLRLVGVWLVLEGGLRGIETDSRALPMVGSALPISYTLTGSLSRVSFCSLGWPGTYETYYLDQADLKLTPIASAS